MQCCLFYNDRPKRRGDEPWEDANPGMGFNYAGGMDVMCARNWNITDNVFTGIGGKTGEARGAIFMWHNSTDRVIERFLTTPLGSDMSTPPHSNGASIIDGPPHPPFGECERKILAIRLPACYSTLHSYLDAVVGCDGIRTGPHAVRRGPIDSHEGRR